MPAVQVKDFPQDLYLQLKEVAAAEDRNMSQEVVHIVRAYVRAMKNDAAGRVIKAPEGGVAVAQDALFSDRSDRIARKSAALDALSKMEPLSIPRGFPDAAALVREGRDKRHDWLVGEASR